MAPIKLSAIKDPVFEVELPDGTVRKYDPWELSAKLAKADESATDMEDAFERTRQVFGLPTGKEVEEARQRNAEPRAADAPAPVEPYTLSRHACVHLKAELMQFIEGLDESKKLSAATRK